MLMRIKLLLAGTAIALGAGYAATPAVAGDICEIYFDSNGGAVSTGTQSLACGVTAQATGADESTAIGYGSIASGSYTVAVGSFSVADAEGVVSIGDVSNYNGGAGG